MNKEFENYGRVERGIFPPQRTSERILFVPDGTRAKPERPYVLSLCGNHFRYSPTVGKAIIDGRRIIFPPKENQLLAALVENRENVVTSEQAGRKVWPDAPVNKLKSKVQTLMRDLRIRIEEDLQNPRFIHTKKDRGYWFGDPENLGVAPVNMQTVGVEYYPDLRIARHQGRIIHLNEVEHRLLTLFYVRQGIVLSRDDIAKKIWPDEAASRAVHDNVSSLRSIFGNQSLFGSRKDAGFYWFGELDPSRYYDSSTDTVKKTEEVQLGQNVVYYHENKIVKVDNAIKFLSPREDQLLQGFIGYGGEGKTAEEIINDIFYGEGNLYNFRELLKKLRKKVGEGIIRTEHRGYNQYYYYLQSENETNLI